MRTAPEHLEARANIFLAPCPSNIASTWNLAGETLNGVVDKDLRDRLRAFIEREIKPPK